MTITAEPILWLRFLVALVAVVALIFAAAWVAKRLGLGGLGVATAGRIRRLAVVDSVSLDPRRRLVLVRRDGMEHLLLLGSSGDLVVERGIQYKDEDLGAKLPTPPPEPPAETSP
ncbi:flagellar protein FliO/FliZ [uncultured Gammaproteobacteria bacterium]